MGDAAGWMPTVLIGKYEMTGNMMKARAILYRREEEAGEFGESGSTGDMEKLIRRIADDSGRRITGRRQAAPS